MTLVYQKLGIYPWADAQIVPAITEISRAVGVPDIAMSCYQARGVGHHKRGRACDFQAGNRARYADSVDIHNAIAKYALANWDRLAIRYMAWDGTEWGGNDHDKNRVRKQAVNYGGSDPWHKNHVHIDFRDGKTPNANPTVPVGNLVRPALTPAPAPKPVPTPAPTTTTPTPTTPTIDDIEKVIADMEATHIVFEFQEGKGKALAIANVLAGTWTRFGSTDAYKARLTVLKRSGAKVEEWKKFKTGKSPNNLADPAAFGVEVKA